MIINSPNSSSLWTRSAISFFRKDLSSGVLYTIVHGEYFHKRKSTELRLPSAKTQRCPLCPRVIIAVTV